MGKAGPARGHAKITATLISYAEADTVVAGPQCRGWGRGMGCMSRYSSLVCPRRHVRKKTTIIINITILNDEGVLG